MRLSQGDLNELCVKQFEVIKMTIRPDHPYAVVARFFKHGFLTVDYYAEEEKANKRAKTLNKRNGS